ncbi:hypothetical protein C1H46_013235 [Malus baccata]|uniref:Uncharacterized protein n=1 Tax=Malus baccata TaxID=106549 RepID=A0A540MQS7_MALBA|nr:hypothetical protein C1H46_013235 [Malus baccata]
MSEAAKDPAIKLFGKTIPVLSFDNDSVGVARAPELSRKRLSIRTAPPPPSTLRPKSIPTETGKRKRSMTTR